MIFQQHHIAVLLLLWPCTVFAHNKCCEGPDNFLIGKKCSDGSNITGITCTLRYMLSSQATENFTISEDGELVIDGATAPVENGQYCITYEGRNGVEIALVCFPEPHMTETSSYFTFRAVCSFISVLFLTATVIVYILVPNLRDLQGKCLLPSIVALDLGMAFLGVLQFEVQISGLACFTIGYITFASFLVAFTWLNVISFHIWRTTIIPSGLGTDKQWYFLYNAWGYGIPLVVMLSAVIGHHVPGSHIKPEIGNGYCWFSDRSSTWAYFYGPIAFLLLINVILFIWTIKKLWTDVQATNNSFKIKSLRYKCLLYIKLFFIMGLSWLFEIVSFALDKQNNFVDYIWLVTDFVNGLQGVLIFIILVAFRKRALRGLAKRGFGCIQLPNQWKTLNDEECDEEVEEQQLAQDEQENGQDSFKSKTNQSVA